MRNLPKFISLLELTREQVQFGYHVAGVSRQDTSSLAEHHYLVAMIGWLLCEYINDSEPLVDTAEVMKICMIHDLGEIFGGDMAAPLSRKRPDLKAHAQAIEKGNFDILTSYLTPRVAEKFQRLFEQEEKRSTQEAYVAKVADMIETHFFLEHRNIQSKQKDDFYENHIRPLAGRFTDSRVQAAILEFLEGFDAHARNKGFTAGKWIIDGT